MHLRKIKSHISNILCRPLLHFCCLQLCNWLRDPGPMYIKNLKVLKNQLGINMNLTLWCSVLTWRGCLLSAAPLVVVCPINLCHFRTYCDNFLGIKVWKTISLLGKFFPNIGHWGMQLSRYVTCSNLKSRFVYLHVSFDHMNLVKYQIYFKTIIYLFLIMKFMKK